MSNIDPKPKFPHVRPLEEKEAHPDMVHQKAVLFSSTIKKQIPLANGAVRKEVSDSVGSDSLRGWVRKNVDYFEPTEGRK